MLDLNIVSSMSFLNCHNKSLQPEWFEAIELLSHAGGPLSKIQL